MLRIILVLSFLSFHFSNAQNIGINEKVFTSLEEAFKNPEIVYNLDLSNNKLYSKFPDSIFKFINLKYLNLKGDHIKVIPDDIFKLQNLKVLDLSGNDFELLPKQIRKLKNLEEIFLGNNVNLNLDKDLKILGKLPNLRILHLENDKIGLLPLSINKLKYLEKLYLNENEIQNIPPYIKKNKKLLFIDMKSNPLQWNGEKPFGITINF